MYYERFKFPPPFYFSKKNAIKLKNRPKKIETIVGISEKIIYINAFLYLDNHFVHSVPMDLEFVRTNGLMGLARWRRGPPKFTNFLKSFSISRFGTPSFSFGCLPSWRRSFRCHSHITTHFSLNKSTDLTTK